MAFIEHGDLSVNLSKEMYQKYLGQEFKFLTTFLNKVTT